jgi:type I restriction enzyme S subunit
MSSKQKITDAREDGNPALVPKLRFPGFDKPWSYDPLSKKLKEHKIKNTAGRDVFSVSMEYGIVNQIELLGRSFAAADPSHYTIGRRFDVVYTKSPLKAFPFGIVKQCKFDGEVALSPLYGVFTPPNPHLGLMIEAYFESPNRSKDFLAPLCQKGAKNTLQITNTTFLSGRLPLPTQPTEQQKISECLSSMDELIAVHAQKLDALKVHKKGLMQQLFPCEGETQPTLRFPEFQNAGGWVEKRLEDLAKRGSGHTPSKSYPEYYNGGIKWISLADSKRLDCGLISDTAIEISEKGIQKSSAVLHPEGTVLISRDAGVGKSAVMSIPMAVSQHFIAWTCKPSLLSNWFLYHLLQNSKPLFERAATGSTIKTIGLQFFKDLVFRVPLLPEQQRIADCLTTLDDLIAAQTQKHEALKTHKKALMQQLFPAQTEV